MSEASLAAQQLAVMTLRASPRVASLLPAANIKDDSGLPQEFPCIIIGEGHVVGSDTDCRDLSEVYLDVHVWTKETGLADAKTIAGAVRKALRDVSATQAGFACDFSFESARFLRDPSGGIGHAVVSFMVLSEDTE